MAIKVTTRNIKGGFEIIISDEHKTAIVGVNSYGVSVHGVSDINAEFARTIADAIIVVADEASE